MRINCIVDCMFMYIIVLVEMSFMLSFNIKSSMFRTNLIYH